MDLAAMIDRLQHLKASADRLVIQHAEFSRRIAELEAHIGAAHDEYVTHPGGSNGCHRAAGVFFQQRTR